MKITIAQLNYHIGNFEKNSESIINTIGKAKAEGSDLVVFSELCVSGYPPLDLLDRADFIEKCGLAVKKIAAACEGITAIIGFPAINTCNKGKKLFNTGPLSFPKAKYCSRPIRRCCPPMIYSTNTGISSLARSSSTSNSRVSVSL